MNRNLILTTLLAVSICSGCSRMRSFTRRDYALLEDPFTSELTDSTAAGSDRTVASPAGRVQLNDLSRDSSRAVADYGGFESESGVVTSGQSAGRGPASLAAFADESANPEESPVSDETLIEGFAEFAAQRKNEWNQQIAEMQDGVEADVESEIRQVSNTVIDGAKPAFDVLNELSTGDSEAPGEEVARPLIQARHAMSASYESPVFEDAAVRAPQVAPIGAANPFAELETAKEATSSVTVPEPVFDEPGAATLVSGKKPVNDRLSTAANPFAEMSADRKDAGSNAGELFDAFAAEQQRQEKTPSAPVDRGSASESLDSGFSFDSGWRPSGAVHPNSR